jgi:DNA-binding response OmpR family regulator
MMPKMDGFQVCRMLKFNDETKDIPIIMLTARAQPADSALGEEVGANQYMSKPFETKELIVNIQKLLG